MFRLVSEHGVVARQDDAALNGTIDRMVRDGRLVRLLPGVYAPPEAQHDFRCRVAALARRHPDVVLTGRTAARLTFWPGLEVAEITAALPYSRAHPGGYRVSRCRVPAELVTERHGLRLTTPALTAVELSADLGGDPIDQALRTRATTLALMHSALASTGGRRGNVARRRMLLDSRDEPWSAAERLAHRLLRAAGVTGWTSNFLVAVGGSCYFLDIAFRGLRVAVEIDGRLHHDDRDAFENDRRRQNALVLDGWQVLRFTWRMLVERPDEVVAQIRTALALAAR